MQVRRATTGDMTAVTVLQDRFLRQVVSEESRSSGFLSHRFSAEEFSKMNQDLAVVVAIDEEGVCGFLCSSDFVKLSSSPGAAMATMASIAGRELDFNRLCIGGPILIDPRARGKSLLAGLYAALENELSETSYHSIIIFIDRINLASLKAHTRIGFSVISEFEHEGQSMDTLLKPIYTLQRGG